MTISKLSIKPETIEVVDFGDNKSAISFKDTNGNSHAVLYDLESGKAIRIFKDGEQNLQSINILKKQYGN